MRSGLQLVAEQQAEREKSMKEAGCKP